MKLFLCFYVQAISGTTDIILLIKQEYNKLGDINEK